VASTLRIVSTGGETPRAGVAWRVPMAFAGVVVFGGLNLVAVVFSNQELPPFFGAGLRFALTGLTFWAIMAMRRVPVPRGRALVGSLLYGFYGFSLALGLAYWALQELPASVGGVIIATVPIFTLLLATLQGLERLNWRGVAGALLGVVGIAVLLYSPHSGGIPIVSAMAMAASALALSQAGIVVKKYPPCHPTAMNAIGVSVGATAMLVLSQLVGEEWSLPRERETWLALAYLVVLGSVAVFALYVFVLSYWPASRASYQFVLMPFVTALGGVLLLDEPITVGFAVGGAIVLLGIYVGALSATPAPPRAPDQEALALRCSTS
jgi:drug/metabolite transporter (DMT)-like permease